MSEELKNALRAYIHNPQSDSGKNLDKYITLSPSEKVEIQSIKIPSKSGNNLNKSIAFRKKASRIATLVGLTPDQILKILTTLNITRDGKPQVRSRKNRSKRNRKTRKARK
jgi:hypothetical protein